MFFTKEFIDFAYKKTEGAEDNHTIHTFLEHLNQRTKYNDIMRIARRWTKYDNLHQTNLAITHAGIYHATRFILLMEFLSMKEVEKDV